MTSSEQPKYAVRLRSRRVQRELDALQGSDYRRILAALQSLAQEPRPYGCEKLYDNVHRVRVGDYRVIYKVDDTAHQIDVGAVRRRSERTYRGVEDLFS